MKQTKRQKVLSALDKEKLYTISDAIEALRPYCSSKFDETLEIAVRLGIDVTKNDQNIRGMLSLPNGTGKTVRVAVFTENAQDDAKNVQGCPCFGTKRFNAESEIGYGYNQCCRSSQNRQGGTN